MNRVKIYLLYKMWQSKQSSINLLRSFKKLKNWWKLYLGLFIGSALIVVGYDVFYPIPGLRNTWIVANVLAFFSLFFLSLYKDFTSGNFMHWYKTNYYEKLRLKYEKAKDNSR